MTKLIAAIVVVLLIVLVLGGTFVVDTTERAMTEETSLEKAFGAFEERVEDPINEVLTEGCVSLCNDSAVCLDSICGIPPVAVED